MFSYIKQSRFFELVKEIELWHRKTFSDDKLTIEVMVKKVYEEAYELLYAVRNGDDYDKQNEIADVFISLIALCVRYNFDFIKCISDKFYIVQNRKYKYVNGKWVR